MEWPFSKKKESQELSENKSQFVAKSYGHRIASLKTGNGDGSEQGISRTEYRGSNLKRAKMSQMELMYANDPVAFNGCNIISSLVNSEGHVLNGEESDIEIVNKWLSDIFFEDTVNTIALHLCIYGNAWTEKVFNSNKTYLPGLRLIDPKSMDFKRIASPLSPTNSLIDLDKSGNPKGYVQHPVDYTDNFTNLNKGIQFQPKEICHFTFKRIADSLLGIGLIEPQQKIILEKMNIEEALAEAIYHIGFPLVIQYCGDESHEPDPNSLKVVSKQMRDIHNNTDITLPYYRKLEILETKIQGMRENLDYYIDQQIVTLGLPKALVLGVGEGTNKATLEGQTTIGARHIATIQQSIARKFNMEIFNELLALGQIKKPVTIAFNTIKSNERLDDVAMVLEGIKAGAITIDKDTEAFIRQTLDMPALTGEHNPRPPIQQMAYEFGMELGKDEKRKRGY